MSDLTPRQQQILDFIRECVEQNGMAPTRAEVALRFGDRIANHHRRNTARAPPTIASSVRRFTVDPRSARRGPRPPPR